MRRRRRLALRSPYEGHVIAAGLHRPNVVRRIRRSADARRGCRSEYCFRQRATPREVALHPLGKRDPRHTNASANGSALEFRELRYFTVLCEELHFGRAAERLHISQSPLSQAIAQLERKLGTRLLDRSSRHVSLTAAGEVLLDHARRLLRDVDDAVGATRRAGAGETGTVRIAVGPIARVAVLPGLRHELDEVFPTLGVEIV